MYKTWLYTRKHRPPVIQNRKSHDACDGVSNGVGDGMGDDMADGMGNGAGGRRTPVAVCLSRYALFSSPLLSTFRIEAHVASPLLSATRFNPHPIRLSTSLSTFTLSTSLSTLTLSLSASLSTLSLSASPSPLALALALASRAQPPLCLAPVA